VFSFIQYGYRNQLVQIKAEKSRPFVFVLFYQCAKLVHFIFRWMINVIYFKEKETCFYQQQKLGLLCRIFLYNNTPPKKTLLES